MSDDARIDAAARSVLARRAELWIEDAEMTRTTVDPDDTEAVQERLAVYARQLRDGTLTVTEEDR